MDYLPEWVTVEAFWTTFLIVHGLLAVALLGALTHQAVALLLPLRSGAKGDGFVARFRSVTSVRYANAVCVLWLATFVIGAWLYAKYRIQVRIPIEQQGYFKTLGAFELKEHLVSFGLGLLPLYWYLWANAATAAYQSARKWLSVWLAAICWYAYLAGHVVNNVRGYGS
jgi:hypothetical protein